MTTTQTPPRSFDSPHDRPGALAASTGSAPRTARRSRLGEIGLYLLAQLGFLAVLRVLSPRFFYVDDQQAQYLPMFSWMGRHLSGGRPPLLSPEQGAAGNFVADAQYGVYDPLHWGLSWAVGQAGNLNDAAWLLGGLPVVLLGLGLLTVLRSYRCPPGLAIAAAVGVASTGFFLWLGTAWWPLMWSTAWLPWLWYGLATRGRHGVLVTGLAAYALAASGYPYHLPVAAVLVAGQLAERWLAGGVPALRARDTLARCAAGLAGGLAAAPGLLSAAQMLPFTTRDFPVTAAGNPADFVPNLIDVLLGGATLNANVSGYWSGNLTWAPLAATAVFAVPAAALVAWRQVVARPGVPTALLLWGASVVATQLPTYVGPFRQPWRYLADVGVFLPVLVALGLAYGLTLTRRRIALAASLAALQLALAGLRSPRQAVWHLLAFLLAVAAVGCIVRARQAGADRRLQRLCAAGLVLATLGAALLSERAATALNTRYEVENGFAITGEPSRDLFIRASWPSTVQEFRDNALDGTAPDGADLTVMTYGELRRPEGGWGTGVLGGDADLLADVQPGFGYVAVGHDRWSVRSCIGRYGDYHPAADCAQRLLDTVPGTDRTWLDAMASDTVLLDLRAPIAIRAELASSPDWETTGRVGPYRRYLRADPRPGRVAATRGAVTDVRATGPETRLAYGGEPFDSYAVSTGAEGGDLVLRVPSWPGLEATVAGRPVEVTDVDGTLTAVPLPGGLQDAPVTVSFTPRGEPLLVPALLLGGVVVVVATAAASPLRRARRGTA